LTGIQRGGYGYKAIIALSVFGLMPPFISPSEYEMEYDMMTFSEIH